MNNNRNIENIIVCGTLAYDHIMDFPGKFSDHILEGKTHILNVTFTVNGIKESFGGTGGNIVYNLALLGEQPKLVAVAGRDFSKYKKWLKKNKIDISGVKVMKQEMMAKFYVITDRADNQIGGYYPGAKDIIKLNNLKIVGSDLAGNFKKLASGKITAVLDSRFRGNDKRESGNDKGKGKGDKGNVLAIIAPDIVARMVKYAKIFKQNGTPYIFDPGQQITEYNARELKDCTNGAKVLVGNDYEIQLILNKLKIKQKQLEKLVEILIITKGGKGSEIYHQGQKIVIPPAKAKAVLDPTGAGDAYRAGFIKGLVMGRKLEKCGRLAGVVAAYTVEKYGTQTHRFSWRELEKRYEENYGEEL